MKILRIHIKNLNSLRLHRTIDFEQPPLAHADIFAITGNTGAGKTTILDAVTLALYGKVARDKDAHKEVLSYGTTECLAEVEFAADGERYLARWGMHRARGKIDGNLLAPQRELARWSEKQDSFIPIAEKVREVDEAVKEITKLDFERFTRSVLLSQGDFAAFLRAGDKERSDLLERITGTAVYSELSTAAFERYREEEQQLKNLQAQQAQLGLLDEEPVAEETLQAARDDAKEKARRVEQLQKRVQRAERQQEIRQRIVDLEAEQATLSAAEQAFAPQAEQLEKSLTLQAQRPTFQALAFRQKQLATQTEVAATLTTRKAEQSATLHELSEATQKAREELQQQKDFSQAREIVFRQTERLDTQLAEAEKQIVQIERQQQEARQEADQLREEIGRLAAANAALEQEQERVRVWLEAHAKFSDLATQLPLIERERDELRAVYRRLNQYRKQADELAHSLKEQTVAAEQLEKAYEQLDRERQQLEQSYQELLPTDFAPEEQGGIHRLSVAITELQEKKQLLLQLHSLEEAYQQLLQEQTIYEERLAGLIARQQHNNKELLNLIEQHEQVQETLDYRRNIYQQQQLIANYAKDRQALKPGEPCPLCLSESHPFHEHPVEPFVDRAKEELELVQQQYDKLLLAERRILQEETELSREIELIHGSELQPVNGRINEQRTKLLEYEERIAGLLHAPSGKNTEAQRGDLLQAQISGIEQRLTAWRTAQRRLETLDQQLQQRTKKLQDTERNYLEAKGKRDQIAVDLQRSKTDLAEAEERFSTNSSRITAILQPLGYTFDLDTAKATFSTLTQLTADYHKHEQRAQEIAKQLEGDTTRHTARQTALDKQATVLKARESELAAAVGQHEALRKERVELLSDTVVETARQAVTAALTAAEAELQKLTKQEQETKELLAATRQSLQDTVEQQQEEQTAVSQLEQELLTAVQSLGYVDSATAAESLLELEVEQQFQATRETLRRKLAETGRAVQEARKEEEKLRPENTEEAVLEQQVIALQEARTAQEHVLLTLGQLEQRLEQQRLRETQNRELLTKIELQRKEFNRWARLNEVIGQKDGKKFRSFAQGLTLQRLVVLANRHLERLNGRYLISKKTAADLELEIIDIFQADNRRSMYTLSGGESFLISLALALGLSDLAGRHAQIQSLFIDEGFGTLDEHSLDLAISTLENLQASGKTIGIISHVKALKERIGVQIQLHKQSNGFSELRISG